MTELVFITQERDMQGNPLPDATLAGNEFRLTISDAPPNATVGIALAYEGPPPREVDMAFGANAEGFATLQMSVPQPKLNEAMQRIGSLALEFAGNVFVREARGFTVRITLT